jgi:hypothetical protein
MATRNDKGPGRTKSGRVSAAFAASFDLALISGAINLLG